MQEIGAITGHIDVAQLALIAFTLFFFGLVFYLRREDRREGYPLEEDTTGRPEESGVIWIPEPKTFNLPHGGTFTAPNDERETRKFKMERTEVWPGAPSTPTTDNPMLAAVGPGSYAERADTPDLTMEGEPKIVPLSSAAAKDFHLESRDPDPRGMEVVGADREVAGVVKDVWIDKSEYIARYYEVELPGGGAPATAGEGEGAGSSAPTTVLLPVNFSDIEMRRRQIYVNAILSTQFADVPKLKKPTSITFLEEEKIMAYYGGGQLYATPQRAEPLL